MSSCNQPVFQVALHCPLNIDLLNTSQITTGLGELAVERRILLHIATPKEQSRLPSGDSGTVPMLVKKLAERTCRVICIDIRDRGDIFNTDALERCDVYFKRDFASEEVNRLPLHQRNKVKPLGLIYSSRSWHSTPLILRAAVRQLASRLHRKDLVDDQSWQFTWGRLKTYLCSPLVKDFEVPPSVSVEPAILFQTRIWEPHEVTPDNAAEINDLRVQVVRALRQAFGTQFVGGLVPTPLALRDFPDLVTQFPTRRDRYIIQSKRFMIGIYTRGLHHSIAFKLGEYLANSKCIVGEPFPMLLHKPLIEGAHFLGFRTAEECVARCAELLHNRDQAAQMRQANYEYYRAEVEPSAHMLNCLERAFS